MSDKRRFSLWVNITVEADSEDAAFDYVYEAMCLAEGQGLMDHRPETLMAWSVEGRSDSEPMWTSCEKCGKLNIEIVEDSAPEFCDVCE